MPLYDFIDKYAFGLLPGGVARTWKGGPLGVGFDFDFQLQQATKQRQHIGQRLTAIDEATGGLVPGGKPFSFIEFARPDLPAVPNNEERPDNAAPSPAGQIAPILLGAGLAVVAARLLRR